MTCAIFSAYYGMTPSNPHYPDDLTPCQCGIEIRTSSHLITSCHLPDHTSAIKFENYIGTIKPETIFEQENALLMLTFLKSTRIGFYSNINYDPTIPPQNQSVSLLLSLYSRSIDWSDRSTSTLILPWGSTCTFPLICLWICISFSFVNWYFHLLSLSFVKILFGGFCLGGKCGGAKIPVR
jgi:hypothetical protein